MQGALFYGFWPLLLRGLISWKPYWPLYYIRIVEIPLGLYAYGLGFAAMAVVVKTQSYAAFVLPGLLIWTLWLAAIIEATYMLFGKIYTQKIWESVLATPARLPALMLAEQVLGVMKGVPLIFMTLPFALYAGALPSPVGFLLAVPLLALFILTATAFGHWLTSFVRHEYQFDYVWPLFVLPMFLFSGMMFPLESLPLWLQWVAQIFPMTHVLGGVRPLMLGQFGVGVLGHAVVLAVLWAGFSGWAYFNFKKRLLDA